MKVTQLKHHSPAQPAAARDRRGGMDRLRMAAGSARRLALVLLAQAPGTARATQSGAADAASALQTLPDSTLLGLVATSVGLGAGFYLAGKRRLVVAAGMAPAVLAGAAIILRPVEPRVPADAPG